MKSSKKVPVVVYSSDGDRKIVGEASVLAQGGHVFISAKVEPIYAERFGRDVLQVSMGPETLSYTYKKEN